jgi:RimJ/RimL family protein N-acetyltransferase
MKKNQNVILKSIDEKTMLIPYRKEHVLKYHEWMQDVELQEQTASEPLSLQQEYEMQQSWFEDEKKCTFIIKSVKIIGDVNLYFNDFDDPFQAEIEVMIAEKDHRRLGFGKTAVLMMMYYGATELKVSRFIAKISIKNIPSIALFTNFGFVKVSESEYFKEVTLERKVDDSLLKLCQTVI